MSIDDFLRSKAFSDVRKTSLAPAPVEPPPVEEPGLIETGLRGVARGTLGIYSGVGSAAEWAGDVTGSQGLRSFGTTLQDLSNDEIQTGVGALNGPSFEGSFTENPSLKRTVGVVAQAVPSLGLAVATGGTASAGLRAAGLGLRAAQTGGAATAASGLGVLEGAPQYSEARQAGKSVGEASAVGTAATVGTALLEYLPIGKILGEAGKGAVRTGLTGAVTEGLQEGTQTVWQNLVAKLGYDQSRSLAEGMVESMVGGAGAGGVVGGITGHVQQKRDTAMSRTLQALMPEGAKVSVDNGMASVEAAGRSFQAPVQTVATALASGVSFDDLADAYITLLDEVTAYIDAQQRQTTAPAVETGGEVVQVQEPPKATNPPRFVKSDEQGLTYNMRGQDYTYAPLEGQTVAQLQEKIAGMPDAQAVAYLKQNASLVQQEEAAAKREDEPTFSRKITDKNGNKIDAPTVFYRGEREGGDRSVSGNDVWDSLTFASSDKAGADLYAGSAGSVTELRAKPETKILYEGTKEFRSLNKGNTFGGPKGTNLLDWASETVARAKDQGYDAVWFKRQSDVGTAIINRSAFEGEADLKFLRENIPQSPATLGAETDTTEIQALSKGIGDYLNTTVAPGTFAQAETPEAMKRLTPLLEIRLGKKIVYFTAKDAPMQIAGVTGIADDIIYINADTKTPHLAVVGHEFLHELKRANAAEYEGILQAVQKIMPREQFETMQGELDSARSAEGQTATPQTLVYEETTADYFGEQFMTKQFWEKAQRNHPQQFVSLAQKFVQFVQKVKDTFTGKQLSDIEKAQDVAAAALRKYAKKNGLENDPRFMRGEDNEQTRRTDIAGFPADDRVRVLAGIDKQAGGRLFGGATPRVSGNGLLTRRLSAIAGVFGHDVTLLASGGGERVDGFIHPLDSKNIYVFDRGSDSPLVVMGHELVHHLKRNRPDLYIEMAQGLAEIKDDIGMKRYFNTKYKDQISEPAPGEYNVTKEATEEWVAGVVGRNMATEGFWDGFAEQRPSLAARVATVLKELLNMVLSSAPSLRMTEATIKDLRKAEQITAKVLAEYTQEDTVTFSREPWYFSKMQEFLDKKLPGKGPAKQILMQIQGMAKKGEFKMEELEWSGLVEYLQAKGSERVTKQEIVDFIESNGVKVEEVVKGARKTDKDIMSEIQRRFPYLSGVRNSSVAISMAKEGDLGEVTSLYEQYDAYVEDDLKGGAAPTKYSDYTLPGGENYRELLLTLPNNEAAQAREIIEASSRSYEEGVAAEEKHGMSYKEALRVQQDNGFKSSHWDEPNILAHIRLNERTVGGEKVLFIEEIQSDWAGKGRKKGFREAGLPDGYFTRQTGSGAWVVARPNGVAVGDSLAETEQGAVQEYQRLQGQRNLNGVPKAPFVTSSKWQELALKRMLRYAAEGGFDRIAWVTGEQTAERYSLDKQVDELSYIKEDDGTYSLGAYKGDAANPVMEKDGVKPEELESVVGKEIADRILKGGSEGTLSGDDLKIEAQWARNLYDKAVPDYLRKFGKKYGVGVEKTNLNGTTQLSLPVTDQMRQEINEQGLPLFMREAVTTGFNKALKQGQQQLERAAKAALNPKAKLHQLAVEHAPKWLSVMPLQTTVELFGKKVAQLKSIYDRLNQTVTIKNDLVDVAYVLRDEAHKLATKTVGLEAFNKAAELGTFNRMLPWEDIYSQEWVPATGTKQQRLQQAQEAWVAAGMQKATKLTFVQAYAESRDAYDALKHDELKQAYKSAVDYMKNIRNRERDNLLAYIESVSDEGTALRKQLMQRFEASFTDIQGAYWPLSRFGDFTLSFTDTNGFRIFKTFPTYADALQVQEALIAAGEVEAGNINVSRKDEKTAAKTAIPEALKNQLLDAVQAKYTEGISAEDEVAYDNALQRAQSTVQEMNQIWLRWQPETSALKNSMRRGNVKGYDKDMLRGFLNYVQHHASRIAWSEQGRKIEQDMQEMAAEVSELGKGEGATDTALQQAILNDMRLRLQTLKTAKVGWFPSFLGKLGTAYFMTSPSIALVQMSQLAVLTLPKLATMYSVKGATTALSKGTVQALSQQYNRDAMFADADVSRIYDMMREAVSQQTRQEGQRIGEPRYTQDRIKAEIAKLTPEQQRLLALREAMARNLLDISATHEAYELTQGKNPDSPLRKAFYYAMAPMRLSELASRKTAVLATFELATEKGKDFFGAMDDIAEVVNDTLYSYAKENKGWRMQGGLARVLLMFRHYQIMTAIRMGMLFKDSIKGESAEVRALARREFIGIMGMTGILAGSLGLPLSQAVFTILDMVLGDDDEPMDSQLEFTNWLNATLGETAGNVAAKGLPTLLGMDLSRRIGLQDIYGMGQDAPAQLHGSSLAAWHAAHMLGPTYSVFEGWFKGYDQMMNKGNYLRGLEEATPKPIRDMLKAYRSATEGVKTTAGKRLVADEDMGVDEIISMALGFYPDELSKAQANQGALLKMSTRISERRGKLIRQAARAVIEGGDPMEAYEGIRTFNSKMPRFKIGSGDVRSAIKARSKGELGTTGVRERAVAQQYGIDALGVE